MRDYLYSLATDKRKGLIAGIIKCLLFLLSLAYGAIVRTLSWFFRLKPCRLNCKVISVGNITLGGTGKTVLVEYIARYLKGRGHKVAILTRGYKRQKTEAGDEPDMLKRHLEDVPVIVDADRRRAALRAITDFDVDTVILDDGFEQWRIARDLEILTIDAVNPFGNRQMLPRGILREPLCSLKRADIFVLTKADLGSDVENLRLALNKLNPASIIVESIHEPISFSNGLNPQECLSLETLKGKTVILFSGIGDPASFEELITRAGIKVGLSFRFPDHHHYSQADMEKIIQASKDKNIAILITTEKDTARLIGLPLTAYRLPFLALRIKLTVKNEQEFLDRLLKLYSL